MDGFSGYNQILMALEDMEKTVFIIEWGVYCYRDRADHLVALERFFERIRQFRLRLNPKKCTFGVTSRKLLGYMVSERGIKADSKKIRAILEMPTLRTEKEIGRFLGRLQCISRFIVRLTNICHLASLLVSDSGVIDDDFLDEGIVIVTRLPGWGSVVLTFPNQYPTMNNIVKYKACILGLETALELESRIVPAYCYLIDDVEIHDDFTWYYDIYQFLIFDTYPKVATTKDKRALRQ
ncbi:hypothetical protein CK203_051788 [Vitis vinifera]|uniref:Reverse transcriptase domain-containing protein n=1 Tax=Vitis vinifera TaxID=29760 RepID=A0A438HG57_VITVI|nr:hypothetical protein CK203_051788 [Vitis vinifera]